MVAALTRVEGGVERTEPSTWTQMMQQASVLVRSGFLPDSIKTAEQAVAIILTGEELGIPKMLALRSINVIKGKPTLSADLMAALIHREIDKHKDGLFNVQPPTAAECTVRFRRWGTEEVKTFTYTMEDAKRSGVASTNQNYQRHPKAMLKARAISGAARMEFQDVISGLYAPEELEDEEPAPIVAIAHELDVNAEDLAERQSGHEEPERRQLVRPGARLPIEDREANLDSLSPSARLPDDEDIIDAETGEIVQESFAPPPAEAANGRMTREQNQLIKDIVGRLGWDKARVQAFAGEVTGITNASVLSEKQAKDLIHHLLAELRPETA